MKKKSFTVFPTERKTVDRCPLLSYHHAKPWNSEHQSSLQASLEHTPSTLTKITERRGGLNNRLFTAIPSSVIGGRAVDLLQQIVLELDDAVRVREAAGHARYHDPALVRHLGVAPWHLAGTRGKKGRFSLPAVPLSRLLLFARQLQLFWAECRARAAEA